MSQTITLLLYPVTDMVAAKKLYASFLQAEPYVDQPYYIGFKVGALEVGLTPANPQQAAGSPIAYTEVENIQESLKVLVEAGANISQEPKDVGGGMLVAAVKDSAGNTLGLRQQS